MMHKILLIIPAYNEVENLKVLIPELQQAVPECELIVINDGSHDGTEVEVKKLNCPCIHLPFNSGIGTAVQTGLFYAINKDIDVTVQVDGDGQHIPGEIPKLLKAVVADECDVAIGSRFIEKTTYQSTITRRVGINLFSMLIKLLTGKTIKDPTSGFRAFNRKAITFLVGNYAEDYPEVESNLLLLVQGFRLKEIPVQMRQRKYGTSSINSIKSLYYMIKVSLCLFLVRLRGRQDL